MKIIPNKIIAVFLGLLCCNFTFAAPNPPEPIPPPPPGLPIDEALLILVLISLILGFYKIFNIKKALR